MRFVHFDFSAPNNTQASDDSKVAASKNKVVNLSNVISFKAFPVISSDHGITFTGVDGSDITWNFESKEYQDEVFTKLMTLARQD